MLGAAACCHERVAGGALPLTAGDTVLMVLPQFHVAALERPAAAGATRGSPRRRWTSTPARSSPRSSASGVTAMMGVPTTYQMLAAHPCFATTDLSRLRLAVVGGAPVEGSPMRGPGTACASGPARTTEAGPNVLWRAGVLPRIQGWLEPYPGVTVRLDERDQVLVRTDGLLAATGATPPHRGRLRRRLARDR